MMRVILLLLVTFVAVVLSVGCSSFTVPEKVNVEVAVPCVREMPAKPQVRSEAELLAMPRYARTLASWSDRLALLVYSRELEAVLGGCSRLPSS